MAKMVGPKGAVNARGWQNATQAVGRYSQAFRDGLNSTGMWEASQLRLNSATDDYIGKLEKSKVTFRDMWRSNGRIMQAAYRDQLRYQNAFVQELPGTARGGRKMYDLAIPTEVNKSWDTFGNRVGWVRENLRSASIQLTNWGKNTQWAGRQLMVGLSMPIVAFGALTGKLAYDVDKQLTRITKVYDTTADQTSNDLRDMAAVETEFAKVRADAWATAETATKRYAASAKDTLSITAELAAQGVTGSQLNTGTQQIMRISALGEVDPTTSLKAYTSLMNVMGMTAEQVGHQFDYMNSVENATSLATADFAAAIPIALGPLKEMGGDVQDLGLLLVAMKSQGIEASEGANAIKSMMQRLYRPSKQIREEWEGLAGIDLNKMVKETNGNVMQMLENIRGAVQDLSRPQRVKLLGGLFGTYQVGRQNAILKGLASINEEGSQMNRTLKINQQSWGEWAKTSERELAQMQASASFQFKQAVENIKNQLAEMGPAFMDIGTNVLKVISNIIGKMEDLPDPIKNFAKYGAIIVALVGPLTMIVGLFANFAGTMGRLGVATLGLFGKMEILNRETAASNAVMKLAERGMLSAGQATSMMAAAMTKMVDAQKAAMDTSMGVQGALATESEKLRAEAFAAEAAAKGWQELIDARILAGKPVPANATAMVAQRSADAAVYHSMADDAAKREAEKSSTVVANNAEKTAKGMNTAAVAGGIFAASLAASMLTSNKMVNDIAQWAMIVSLLGPSISAVAKGIREVGVATMAMKLKTAIVTPMAAAAESAGAWASLMRKDAVTGASLAASRMKAGMAAALTSTLAISVAIAAIAASAYIIWKHMQAAGEEARKTYQDVEGLGKLYNYAPTEVQQIQTPKGPQDSDVDRINKFRDEYGGIVKNIQEANTSQEKFNTAMQVGMRVLSSGGTAENAKQAVIDALRAAEGYVEGHKIAMQFKPELNFDDIKTVMEDFRTSAMTQIAESVSQVGDKGFWEKQKDSLSYQMGAFSSSGIDVGRLISDNGLDQAASEASIHAAQAAADSFYSAYGTAMQNHDMTGVKQALVAFEQGVAKYQDEIASAYSQGDEDRAKQLEAILQVYQNRFGQQFGLTDDELANLRLGASALDLMGKNAEDLTYDTKATVLENKKNLNALELARLGSYEVLRNQKGVTQSTGEGADAQGHLAGQIDRSAQAANRLKKAIQDIDWSQQAHDIMSSVTNSLGDIAAQNFQNQMDAAMTAYSNSQNARMDALQRHQEAAQNAMEARQAAASRALENRQQAQTDAFEARWERRKAAVTKAYDDRIKAINKEIEAETKAEDTRKRIFEAEMARIQRLNQMQNQTIDFNVQLDTGNLDEAAKIRNDMLAQQEQWNLEDQDKRAAARSARTIDRLNKQIDKIEKIKDKRLEMLDKVEEKERRSLERMQERQTRALQKRQEQEQRALEARQQASQDALQAEIDNNIAAQQEIWDNRKKKVDQAIALFEAYVPRNEKDLREHIKRISEKYTDFNVTTEGKFNKTAVDIGRMITDETKKAANAIKSDIQWETIGDQAAKRMIQGALGMTWGQFRSWMTSGNWPKGVKGDPANGFNNQKNYNRDDQRFTPHHTGGMIGHDKGSRKGVARTNPMHSSEQMVLAQKGEFMVNKHDAAKNLGILEQINSGKYGSDPGIKPANKRNTGGMGLGAGLATGFAGIMGSFLRQAMFTGIGNAIMEQHQRATDKYLSSLVVGKAGTVPAGVYGDIRFGADQLANARTIANVGKEMGMSARDIEIGIMTAITESMLRNVNYGDRDSLGLFQQRSSWGSAAQRTDPKYASHRFFMALKSVSGRDSMTPWMAAQAVQRSAYSDGSNYHQYWNEGTAIYKAMMKAAKGTSGGFLQGGGGRHRPVPRGYGLTQGIHDEYTGYPAIDIGVPVGTSVFAAADGKVTKSYDLVGNDGRVSNGGYYSYGRVIYIDHGPFETLYAHLSQRYARAGQSVKGGALIGKSGNTGHSFGPHLHFGAHGINPNSFMGLKKGAENIKWDNTIANLHHGETVLTEDLSRQFKQGVANFANGGNSEYNVNVNVLEPGASADEIANAVTRGLAAAERRRPKSRKAANGVFN